ncbi:hypothetical protein BGW38_009693, partial [Lunasporangiospora selenospora]
MSSKPSTSESIADLHQSPFYRLAKSPYPEWSLSALCAVSVPMAMRRAPAMPHFGVMMGFSAIFAGSG